VALAREMLVINNRGQITPTPLIEALQIRVYRDTPPGDPRRPQGFDSISSRQDFYELRLSRKGLFAGRNGGLSALGPEAREFPVFMAHPDDVFERATSASASRPAPAQIMQTCKHCHGAGRGFPANVGPGIHSVLAYRRGFTPGQGEPPHLVSSNRRYQAEAAIHWKRQHYSWGLLQGLMVNQKGKEKGDCQPR
jgi:hypothetical protein